jgi:outer membrane protein
MKSLLVFTASLILLISHVFGQSEKLSLEDCINIALKANPNIKINKNLNESAEEDVTGSYSSILPTVSLSANSGRAEAGDKTVEGDIPIGFDSTANQAIYVRGIYTQPGYVSNFNSVDFRVSQNIFDGGEWWNAIEYAKSQKNSSDYNLQSVINQAVKSVHERFFDLAKQQKLLEVRTLALQRSEDQLNKTQKMFELGSVAKVDVYRSKVNYGNDKIALLQQKNAVISAKNNLNLIMGQEPRNPIEIETELVLIPAYGNTNDLFTESMEMNPTLKKFNEDFNSSDIAVSRSYAVLYPSLAAFFNYGRSHEEFDRVYGEMDKNWNLNYGVSVSFNLFNGFQDKVRIQKNKLAARNAQESFEDYKRTLKASISQLTDSYNSYLEIITINEENLVAAKEEYRLAEERYRIGSGTSLEVREAQLNLTQAEQTLVAAQYNARIVQAQIDESLGSIHTQ